jgi:Ca2+/Na+ antiporter
MRIGSNVLIILLIMGGAIWLQVFLAKKESKWLGLILPFIAFAGSLLMVFSIMVNGMTTWQIFGLIASTFLMANIPTIILLAIYWGCREKIREKKALEKMNIQDLE